MNSITVYLANDIIGFRRLALRFVGGDVKDFLDATVTKGFEDLIVGHAGLGLGILLCRFLYRRKFFAIVAAYFNLRAFSSSLGPW